MENIQINGQRIRGPPEDWTGQPPPHGTEVFIKNIPDDIFEDELYYLFSNVGRVYQVRLPVHWTGVNKGYAFVRFTKVSEADKAIERLNSYTIRHGRKIKVERSLDNTRLFLSSVPNHKTGEEIKNDLLTMVENVKTVYAYPALKNPSFFRGYAFVEFISHRDAAIAKRILTPDVLFNLFERKCVAAWANPLPYLNEETLRNVDSLFMRNIPNGVKTLSLRIAIDSLISPDSVNKIKRLYDYAFLTFKDHDMADRALTKIKNNPFLLGLSEVHIEWATPRELAKSFAIKSLDTEINDESESIIAPNTESNHSLSKIYGDLKITNPRLLMDDYIDMNCLSPEEEYNSLQFSPNVKILQRLSIDSSSPVTNKVPKIGRCENFVSYAHKNNINQQNDLLSYLTENNPCKDNIFKQRVNANDHQLSMTEFQNSEFHSRNAHLKNWLQSLSPAIQHSPRATSPSLSSPSTGSSSGSSWKWDDGCGQLYSGNENSMGHYLRSLAVRDTTKNRH